MARDRITIGSTTELLNDARLPASLGTAGQMLKMNSGATAIEWGEGGGDSISRNASDALVVSAGTNTAIEANPTLTGTETTLAGLKVGDTKYAVSSGGGKYLHRITMQNKGSFYVRAAFQFIDSTSTPYTTITDVANAMYAVGITFANSIPISGVYANASTPSTSTAYKFTAIGATSSGELYSTSYQVSTSTGLPNAETRLAEAYSFSTYTNLVDSDQQL